MAKKTSKSQPASPWAGADYKTAGRPPSTAAIGSLARDIAELYRVAGPIPLLAAVLLDQGRVTEALDALAGVLAAREAEHKAERDARAAERDGLSMSAPRARR